jgi:UDP-GlcNAc:undecaprenyl-phosphate GlcNAc-1-phosphate transferase
MYLGLNARGVDAVLYALQIIIGILVYVSVRLQGRASLSVLAAAYAVVIAFFSAVHFLNRKANRLKTEAHGQ